MSNGEQSKQAPRKRLVGWLVSYAGNDLGEAHEIWSGRTFVSAGRSSLANTIEVAASDVSTPHLAMSASPKHRVMVQDIFSDQGSFLQKNGQQQEQPVRGPTEIEHGDWIRVGKQVRFQVCLIDGPSR